MNYPKITYVKPLKDMKLEVHFDNDEFKLYDCTPLLKKNLFKPLKNKILFKQVQVDSGGYGIIWNNNIDLAESELYLNGKKKI